MKIKPFQVLLYLIACFVLASLSTLKAFDGSLAVSVDQRFFDDERFGNVNGFSQWWAPHFEVQFGVVELPYRIEPILSFGYIQNTATACAVASDGETCLSSPGGVVTSEDRFKYQIFSFGGGLRWKAWERDFFWASPFIHAGLVMRYARVRKKTANVDERKLVTGADLGANFTAGVLISFLTDQKKKNQLDSEWNIKDFGLSLHGRYLPAGWWKKGLGTVDNTGGASFGVGLVIDW